MMMVKFLFSPPQPPLRKVLLSSQAKSDPWSLVLTHTVESVVILMPQPLKRKDYRHLPPWSTIRNSFLIKKKKAEVFRLCRTQKIRPRLRTVWSSGGMVVQVPLGMVGPERQAFRLWTAFAASLSVIYFGHKDLESTHFTIQQGQVTCLCWSQTNTKQTKEQSTVKKKPTGDLGPSSVYCDKVTPAAMGQSRCRLEWGSVCRSTRSLHCWEMC